MEHRAFLAMPFRPELRWVREAIRSAVQELGIQLRAVDELVRPGEEVVAAVRQEIRAATLAYVVLTDLNPNVMYELGLLHEASKPTILLGEPETVARLPFDIRTRLVITFEPTVSAAPDLTRAVVTATGRLLALYEPSARQQFVATPPPPSASSFGTVQLSISNFDWERLKNDGAKAVGRSGCTTKNISPHDDGTTKGWRLKARCTNGDVILVYVDLNGDVVAVDVE